MRRFLLAVLVLAVIAAAVFWFLTIPGTVPASALGSYTPNLENGKTMFYAGGCASCHATPDQEDKTRLGGGMALKSPFGTFYAPNISSDARDGIGGWSEADFVSAMWKGTSPDGRHYYPAFPYTSYQKMKMEDVRDLFAHLKTLPAVTGKVRDHDLPAHFKIRRLLGAWKFLFLDGEPFKPDASKPAAWNRGAYLVNAPGHCAECHSPRNLLGGIVSKQRFAGGPDPEGGDGSVPNITQAGLGDYSEKDIAQVLATGEMPNGDSVGGGMTAVVRNTGQLTPEDRAAMATYVKSLPPVEGPK
ncbi:MAG: cytochrome c [Xanthobacteraceae bacterium]|jgi:mono/diheme cytochrome c family protein